MEYIPKEFNSNNDDLCELRVAEEADKYKTKK